MLAPTRRLIGVNRFFYALSQSVAVEKSGHSRTVGPAKSPVGELAPTRSSALKRAANRDGQQQPRSLE